MSWRGKCIIRDEYDRVEGKGLRKDELEGGYRMSGRGIRVIRGKVNEGKGDEYEG